MSNPLPSHHAQQTPSRLRSLFVAITMTVTIALLLAMLSTDVRHRLLDESDEEPTGASTDFQQQDGQQDSERQNTLRATVHFDGDRFEGARYVIRNEDSFAWTNVRFSLRFNKSIYEYRLDLDISADEKYYQLSRRLGLPSEHVRTRADQFTIECDQGSWTKDWQAETIEMAKRAKQSASVNERDAGSTRNTRPDMTPSDSTWSYRAEPSQMDAITEVRLRVRNRLRSPSTASFGYETINNVGDQKWSIRGHVDSQNGFGAVVRTHYTATAQLVGRDPTDSRQWQVQVVFH